MFSQSWHLVALLWCCLPTWATTNKPPVPLSSVMTNRISALVNQEMFRRHIPGMALGVVQQGRIISMQTFGVADMENNVPVTTQTIFRFASVSKPITAVATLQLVEAGRLSLNAFMRELHLDVPAHLQSITVRQLLAHQSGLRHYQTYAHREPIQHFANLNDAFRAHASDPLLFKSGTSFSYTTYGYLLLGCVVEQAGDAPFLDQLRSRIFLPAGMTNARVDNMYEIIPHRAQGYFRSVNGELRNSEPMDLSSKIPGGGICGTITDLAAFAAALQNGRLLSARTLDLMWTPQTLVDGTLTSYGLGWRVVGEGAFREMYHAGTQPRTSSFLYLENRNQTAVVILSNLEQVDFLPLARRISELVAAR